MIYNVNFIVLIQDLTAKVFVITSDDDIRKQRFEKPDEYSLGLQDRMAGLGWLCYSIIGVTIMMMIFVLLFPALFKIILNFVYFLKIRSPLTIFFD